MAGIYSFNQYLPHVISNHFTKHSFQFIHEWKNRVVSIIQTFSGRMHQNSTIAFNVFLIANTAFFTLNHILANWLEQRTLESPKELDNTEQRFNCFLINGLIVGCSTLTLNVMLSNITQYPISHSVKIAIVTTSIVMRLLLSSFSWNEIGS